MTAFTKMLTRAARPAKNWMMTRFFAGSIQRHPLLPEDLNEPFRSREHTVRRRRRHVLVDLVHEQCPGQELQVVEIGMRNGRTSNHILKYCPQIHTLHCVDLRPRKDDNPFHHLERQEYIQSDSAEAADRFEDGSMDLVFIDADHTEAGVRRDVLAWLPKVKSGGVVAGHDYGSHTHPGVAVAVDDIFRDHPHPIRVEADRVWWTIR